MAFSLQATPTDEEIASFKNFIYALPDILPCKICGEHLRENLKILPPPLKEGGDAIFRWTIRLHNTVNKQLGKPTLTDDEAIAAMLHRLFGVRPISTAQEANEGRITPEKWASLGATLAIGGLTLAAMYALRG